MYSTYVMLRAKSNTPKSIPTKNYRIFVALDPEQIATALTQKAFASTSSIIETNCYA